MGSNTFLLFFNCATSFWSVYIIDVEKYLKKGVMNQVGQVLQILEAHQAYKDDSSEQREIYIPWAEGAVSK